MARVTAGLLAFVLSASPCLLLDHSCCYRHCYQLGVVVGSDSEADAELRRDCSCGGVGRVGKKGRRQALVPFRSLAP